MTKLIFIYLSSIILFYINFRNSNERIYFQSPKIHEKIIELEKNFFHHPKIHKKMKKYTPLVMGFLSGNKRWVDKKMLRPYKLLNLYHLFTPSGLHLTSFIEVVKFVFKWGSTKLLLIIEIFLLILLTYIFVPIGGYFSLKRMLLFRMNSLWIPYTNKLMFSKLQWNSFYLFLLTFSIDFFFGTYQQSPLSFCYSYIFLGCIIVNLKKAPIKIVLSIIGGQILCAYVSKQGIYIPSLFFNFFLSSLFTLLFPFFILCVVFPFLCNYLFYITIIPFHYLVEKLTLFPKEKFWWEVEFIHIILVFLFALPKISFSYKKNILIIYFIASSNIVNNGPSFLWKEIRGNNRSLSESLTYFSLRDVRKITHTFHSKYEKFVYYQLKPKKILLRCKHPIRFYSYQWNCFLPKGRQEKLRLRYIKKN